MPASSPEQASAKGGLILGTARPAHTCTISLSETYTATSSEHTLAVPTMRRAIHRSDVVIVRQTTILLLCLYSFALVASLPQRPLF